MVPRHGMTWEGCGRGCWRQVLLAGAVVLMTGCAQSLGGYSPAQSPKTLHVHWNWLAHPVLFEPASDVLSNAERRLLDGFLDGVAPRPGDRWLVGIGDSVPPRLGATRLAAVSGHVRRHLSGATVSELQVSAVPLQGVHLLLGRPVVRSPACPDWSRLSGSNPGNVRDSNHGCAAVTNLGLMVANPSDLVQGRRLAPGDGHVLSTALWRYRTDQVKNPVEPTQGAVAPDEGTAR